ncbi:HhH-GPD superfamily base excision DNA repair protein [Ceratobasidium sp. AG-Ba]|nr:HhH-GPD superfamily base excision DNA repair protein [Ceratobasidium sp. AG-Ba]
MSSSTTVRRSTRAVKQVTYAAPAENSSDSEDEPYDHPITISDSSDAEMSPVAPRSKRQRVPKATKSTKPAKSSNTVVGLDVSSSYEPHHTSSRHDPHRLLPCLPALLKWFEEKRDVRGMPWRKTYDPALTKQQRGQRAYEVLVSEIMLQQTQVATVIPYYNRWLDRQVLFKFSRTHIKQKGLGYYRRAGFLLAAAKKVKAEYGGHIPEDVKIMQKDVPGMGRYTAGAVASIAYGIKAPVLDGNVQRLLSRALAIYANPKAKQTLDMLWGAAIVLVEAPTSADDPGPGDSGARPGNINQALIELGSTVCRPASPLCGECPLKSSCAAYEITQPTAAVRGPSADIEELCGVCEPLPTVDNSVTRFPMKAEKKKAREETSVVCAIQWTNAKGEEWWLMSKRPATGLLAGLWEFPTLDLSPASLKVSETSDSEHEKSLHPLILTTPSSILPQLLSPDALGAKLDSPKYIGNILHIFSHIHKTYEVVYSAVEWGKDQPPDLIDMADPGDKTKIKNSKLKRKRADDPRNDYILPAQTMWVIKEEVMSQKYVSYYSVNLID